jgi:hypothetical protein
MQTFLRPKLILAISILALISTSPGLAQFDPCQPMPQGPTFTLSQAGGARIPAVAMFPDGRSIVVYETGSPPGNDDSRLAIVARRLDANGQFEGDEFQVNTFIDEDQHVADVAVAPNGAFVVAWETDAPDVSGDNGNIRARVYRPDGSPAGPDFQVNDIEDRWQRRPAVAMNNQGFVVVWDTDGQSAGDDTGGLSVQARRYDANGNALGGQFQVNTVLGGSQGNPDVAMHPDGRFVVAWESSGSAGDDNSSRSVQVRRYAADGTPLEAEQQLNVITAQAQDHPSVAMDPTDASFLVVWQSSTSEDSDNDRSSIQARGMLWNGIPTSQREFQVNQEILDSQFDPNVANVGPKEYMAVWITDHLPDRSSAMRAIGLEGTLIGGQFDLPGTDLRPAAPNVAGNGNGSSLTVYQAAGLDDVVPSNRDGIRARRWQHPCVTGEPTGCVESPTTLCLLDDRFRVTANWRIPDGTTGAGQAEELTPDTGYFWFFRRENVEMVIKVLDACGFNQHFWVFAGGLTSVEVELEVFDTEKNVGVPYANPQNTPFEPIQDTEAFATCP